MKTIDLYGDKKLINLLKKNGFETINPQGEFNGYGYQKLRLHVVIYNDNEEYKFLDLKKSLNEVKSKTPVSKPEEKWCKRLSKLTGISIDEAQEIAKEKDEYHSDQIIKLDNRQYERYSVKRQKLINKISRSNPLRYIKDEEHAKNILVASKRHNLTNYDKLLEEARELVQWGQLDYCDVKEYAHKNK